mgnify:CR=1 FL=1
MGDLNLFRAVLTTLAVLLFAYWCSRLLGKQWIKSSGTGSLQIIEQIQVGQNQRILLLKIGEKNYLVGVSQAGIQMLAEVEGDFQIQVPPQSDIQTQIPFQDVLGKYLTLHQKKKGGDQ